MDYKGIEIDSKPTEAMADEASRGLAWREEFGRGGTEVGVARARDLQNRRELSAETIRRMNSYFARHEVDKQGEGFSPGESGYPSAGRIAWALWGGDAGQSWARERAERMDRIDEQDRAAPGSLKLGDFVSWNSSGGRARGRIEHIMTEGTLGIPDSDFSIEATEDDPAALIRIYRDTDEGWVGTDTLVGHKFSTLTKIQDLDRSIEARPYPNEHAARLKDPDQFDSFRREADAGGPGIDFIFGIKAGVSEIQAIRFDEARFTVAQAKEWLAEHDFNPILFEEAIKERSVMDKQRHIKAITETDESVIIEFSKQMHEAEESPEVDLAEELLEASASVERKDGKLTVRSDDMMAEVQDDRRVRMAISSEMPVMREFGYEVLDHSMESIDLSFLNSGRAPLLLDHDPERQIGVIESVSLDDSARRLRATVRFGKGSLASEVYDDVADGIRGNVSIGYRINKMAKDERAGTYRAVNWMPMEVSVVSIPADQSVGVGRSAEIPQPAVSQPTETRKDSKMENQVEVIGADAAVAKRNKEIAEILNLATKHNQRDLANDSIGKGLSIEQFRGVLLEKIADKPLETPDIGLSAKEVRQYSLMNAIKSASSGRFSGFEAEVAQELARKYGKEARGFYVPTDIFKRDILTSSPANGSNLVPTDHLAGEFIDALRANLVISGLGARMMQGLKGDVAIPALNAKTSVGFVAENNAPGSEGAPSFRQVTMSPKTLVQYVDISRKLMMQSDPSVEQVIRDDMTRQFAAKIDEVAIEGGGAAEPTGILGTSGIGSVAIGTNGGAITFASLVNLEREVAIDNALAGRLSFLTNPKVVAAMRRTPRQSSGVEGNFILNDTNTLLGYGVASTTLVPSDLTKGTSSGVCSAVIFGNFNDLMIGMFGGLDVLVDPYTGSATGATRIAMYQDVDVAVRHAESFAAIKDVTTV
jgi:HK97 family phage major capsid protein/HK97 family phage prohead protease